LAYSGGMPHLSSPRDASPALQRYVELLQRWNRSVNLVSARDIPVLWTRHIADSLQLATLWSHRPERAIDLGSGGGFPGLVLAIEYGVPFDLIEQDQGKAAFLREAARVTGAPVTVVATKIEAASVPRAPLMTARGLAPLSVLLGYAENLLAPGGECLFLKGRGVATEIAETAQGWTAQIEQFPSETDSNGVILRVSEIARV
jgi:16S rRNA (guanine527-N7)-methyltransferase